MNDVTRALQAVARAQRLLSVVDGEHKTEALYTNVTGTRHELETVHGLLTGLGGDVVAATGGLVRADAPATSRTAADALRTRSGTLRHKLLHAIAERPRADFQLQADLGMSGNTERPRRVELSRAGYVARQVDTTNLGAVEIVTAVNPATGLRCDVWAVTDLGRAALARLGGVQDPLPLEE